MYVEKREDGKREKKYAEKKRWEKKRQGQKCVWREEMDGERKSMQREKKMERERGGNYVKMMERESVRNICSDNGKIDKCMERKR